MASNVTKCRALTLLDAVKPPAPSGPTDFAIRPPHPVLRESRLELKVYGVLRRPNPRLRASIICHCQPTLLRKRGNASLNYS